MKHARARLTLLRGALPTREAGLRWNLRQGRCTWTRRPALHTSTSSRTTKRPLAGPTPSRARTLPLTPPSTPTTPLALHGALSVGDRVLKIDGEELEGLSAVELNRLVVGPEGSVAEVRFVRAADARTPPQEECVYVTRLAPLAPKSNNPFGVVRAPPAR